MKKETPINEKKIGQDVDSGKLPLFHFDPCTCELDCKVICDGKRCGCKACKLDYEQFLSCKFEDY